MPTLESVEGMCIAAAKMTASLESLKEMIKVSQDREREDQHLRGQRGKGVGFFEDDNMSMFDDKVGYYGGEGKKRRGVSVNLPLTPVDVKLMNTRERLRQENATAVIDPKRPSGGAAPTARGRSATRAGFTTPN